LQFVDRRVGTDLRRFPVVPSILRGKEVGRDVQRLDAAVDNGRLLAQPGASAGHRQHRRGG
jgi:hypothetical protein